MLSIQLRMVYPPVLAPVNTVKYGHLVMTDQLSVQDWLDQGLKTLAASGFTALKAEPLAKAMGVSRGSFYWHFADIGAFHAAILNYWRQVAAEEIIADLEAIAGDESPLPVLLRRAFSGKLALERAIRSWATVDSTARNAVQAIDRRRLDYVESLLRDAGFSREAAQARARILYWTFIGFALSDKPLAKPQQEALLNELTRLASPS
jgi:AcrR family transcriptional regulator